MSRDENEDEANKKFKFQNDYIKELKDEFKDLGVKIEITYQKFDKDINKPKGTAEAVMSAKDKIGDSNYLVLLGDILLESKEKGGNYIKDIVELFNGENLVYTDRVNQEYVKEGGLIVGKRNKNLEEMLDIDDIIPKPNQKEIESVKPENGLFYTVRNGVYILNKKSLEYMEKVKPTKNNEKTVKDAIATQHRETNEPCHGLLTDIKKYNSINFGDIENWISVNLKEENIKNFVKSLNKYPNGFKEEIFRFVLNNYQKDLKEFE